jgi:hypothetical protein
MQLECKICKCVSNIDESELCIIQWMEMFLCTELRYCWLTRTVEIYQTPNTRIFLFG